jgi:hypothetical protein
MDLRTAEAATGLCTWASYTKLKQIQTLKPLVG